MTKNYNNMCKINLSSNRDDYEDEKNIEKYKQKQQQNKSL